MKRGLPNPHWFGCAAGLVLLASATFSTQAQQASSTQPAAAEAPAEDDEVAVDLPVRLLDRPPFDRVTLDSANDNAVLETVLLDLPARHVPDNLPQEGELNIRRLSEPSIPYAIAWSAVAKIELYERMLLEEAERLLEVNDFSQAFEYLAFLRLNYPELSGLQPAMENYLWREASAAFAAGRRDEAWPILVALYARNSEYPRLASAIQAVSDAIIAGSLEAKNYAAVRATLDVLEKSFPKLQLTNAARWRQRLAADAHEQLVEAREAMAAEDYTAAREAAVFAAEILPETSGAGALLQEIQTTAPEIRVGVTSLGTPTPLSKTPTWTAARVGPLVDPRLVQEVDFGPEGGIYASSYGEISTDDAGVETTLRLSPDALRSGATPDLVALQLVEMARPDSPERQEDFAANLERVRTAGGRDVVLHWRWPPVRPEAFLQAPLRRVTDGRRATGLWFDPQPVSEKSGEARYERSGSKDAAAGKPRFIVERIFDDDEAALSALLAGEVDAVDRVPPWQLDRLRGAQDVVVTPYRLPTVHVLVPNLKNPLLEMREFRRALCYAIDREGIVRDILLAGRSDPGYRTLSAPFPAGVALNDPVGYGYNSDLAPRPFDPRLAALLANVARTTLAKREADLKKAAVEAKKPGDKGSKNEKDAKAELPPDPEEINAAPPKPLVLAHAADPLARVACQSIKLQLEGLGIPIKLVEIPAWEPHAQITWDLLYAELAVGEPLFDARRLLGGRGVAGHASALMDAALDELDRAENLKQAQDPLKEIHRIAHYDLPLLPLWQTVNHFARRTNLEGVGENPVALYQNVAAWRKSLR